jgi:Novel toxin 16
MRSASMGVLAFVLFLVTVAGAEPAGDGIKPPGDCTKQRHRDLQGEVGRACKSESMACQNSMSCDELVSRWTKFEACIQARKKLMDECFRGGDSKHRLALREYLIGQEKCVQIIKDKKCFDPEAEDEDPCLHESTL